MPQTLRSPPHRQEGQSEDSRYSFTIKALLALSCLMSSVPTAFLETQEKRHKLITRVLATMLAATLVIALAAWAGAAHGLCPHPSICRHA